MLLEHYVVPPRPTSQSSGAPYFAAASPWRWPAMPAWSRRESFFLSSRRGVGRLGGVSQRGKKRRNFLGVFFLRMGTKRNLGLSIEGRAGQQKLNKFRPNQGTSPDVYDVLGKQVILANMGGSFLELVPLFLG